MKAVPSVGIPSIRSTVSRVLVADLGNWKYEAKLSTATAIHYVTWGVRDEDQT